MCCVENAQQHCYGTQIQKHHTQTIEMSCSKHRLHAQKWRIFTLECRNIMLKIQRRHAQNRLYAQKLMEKLRTQMQKHAQNAKTSCSNHRHHAQNTDVMPKIDLLKIQSCHAESTETMLKISLVPRLSPRQKLHTVKKDLLF